ncbi:MAG: cytochrome-c peroxidase [Halobacteriovoraceae bacterium]|nr:cytochrome-c peroxidase [Halobacteriovoraceae bacterium]
MLFVLLFFTFNFTSCSFFQVSKEDKELHQEAKKFFNPLPESLIDIKKNEKIVSLGKKLYFETKLSKSGTISCNSCHRIDQFGVDNEITSPGHDGTRGGRNSPTTFNSALNFRQFWDGRAKDLEEQALGPILNPIEHGLKDEKEAVKAITNDEYLTLFKEAFPKTKNPISFKRIGLAIAAFEKTLLTPSRFDDYLKGDISALTHQEKAGLSKFIKVGCTTCHSGTGLGGSMYQKLGLVKPYKTKDTGRHEVTKKRRDKFKFKVPLLRNIEKTAPYFHDGSVKTLDEAIAIMAEYQIGKKLDQKDIDDIKAFLSSLTAKKPIKL